MLIRLLPDFSIPQQHAHPCNFESVVGCSFWTRKITVSILKQSLLISRGNLVSSILRRASDARAPSSAVAVCVSHSTSAHSLLVTSNINPDDGPSESKVLDEQQLRLARNQRWFVNTSNKDKGCSIRPHLCYYGYSPVVSHLYCLGQPPPAPAVSKQGIG